MCDQYTQLPLVVDEPLKRCPKCRIEKSHSAFGKHGKNKDGLQVWCRLCRSAAAAAKYREDPAKIHARNLAWRERNPERFEAYQRRYYQEHREHYREWRKRYYAANKDVQAKNNRRWSEENAEHIRARNRAYYIIHAEHYKAYRDANREHISAYRRNRPEHLKEKARAYRRQFHREHPERARAANRKRKALKKGAAITDFSAADWRALLDEYGHRCAYCGCQPEKLTLDHVIPLSRGGNHTKSNCVPACLQCNLSKNDKTPDEWDGPHGKGTAKNDHSKARGNESK